MRRAYLWFVLVLVAALAACGERSDSSNAEYSGVTSQAEQVPMAMLSDTSESDYGYAEMNETLYTVHTQEDRSTLTGTTTGVSDPAVQRRVIYNAFVDLVVDDFGPLTQSVRQAVKKHDAYIASSNLQGSAGEARSAQWEIRVPVGQYDAMLADLEALGQVREIRSTSQEVTAEFVDLQARIKTKELEEQRLLDHLENAIKLDDTLRIEQELSRVRGEVERLQGRLKVLADLSSMSTITLQAQEIENYIPPIHAEPTFMTQLGRAWSGSVAGLGDFLTALSVVLVSITPWLVIIVPAALVGYLVLHRRRAVKAAA